MEETKKGFNARAKAKAILMNANLSPSLELRKERKESLDTEIGEAFDFSSFLDVFDSLASRKLVLKKSAHLSRYKYDLANRR